LWEILFKRSPIRAICHYNQDKGKFYGKTILYDAKCWALKGQHERKVGVVGMRLLRWMCGHARQDIIHNDAKR